ncbi:MAG: TIGR00289 family protein [Candidatus Aenigmarchaeota archaeon]|nr:TIGR00289 family protein [Candidatus Aenigmarchaeota archaeon]MDW8149563.1 TIGR00289 family protein [Candidatus Aenigmarchaeota archaeon]
MKVGILFTGGKDSCLALKKVMKKYEVVCLITLISKNKESYMFHVPNIELTKLQAEAMGLPLLQKVTEGKKEKELEDLKRIINEAKKKFKIKGIVTGAISSNYQKSRIEKVCKELGIECINPLWGKDQIKLLEEIVENDFKVIITGIFAYPLDESFLGKKINKKMIEKLKELAEKYKINPAGEGGEIETTVLDAPFFKKRIKIKDFEIKYKNYSGIFEIRKAELEPKT